MKTALDNALAKAKKVGLNDNDVLHVAFDFVKSIGFEKAFIDYLDDVIEESLKELAHYALLIEEVPATESRSRLLRIVVFYKEDDGTYTVDGVYENAPKPEDDYAALESFKMVVADNHALPIPFKAYVRTPAPVPAFAVDAVDPYLAAYHMRNKV